MIELKPESIKYVMILNAETDRADFTCVLENQTLACGQTCIIYADDHNAVLDCVYSEYTTAVLTGVHIEESGTKRLEADIRNKINIKVAAGDISISGTF